MTGYIEPSDYASTKSSENCWLQYTKGCYISPKGYKRIYRASINAYGYFITDHKHQMIPWSQAK